MAFKTVFKRYEFKYMLTSQQKEVILQAMEPYMQLDQYGRSVIRNIYFDTPDYRLIRRSIDKPVYKEKLRIRGYGEIGPESTVFVELKKKYKHVVYKRRVSLPLYEAMSWLGGEEHCALDTQIAREVDYFLEFYRSLRPAAMLFYEREAYYAKDGSDFRVTFDEDVLFRPTDLSLDSPVSGTPILPEGTVLMELKCSGGIPMWMVHALSSEKLYKMPFSKYGTAYKMLIHSKNNQEEFGYVRELV